MWSHRAVRIACPIVVTLVLLPPATLVHHVYFDRSDLPELAAFILFQPPTTGEVTDVRGEVVIQLAREYRRVVTYDEVPLVVRQAILAAEDKNFLSHSGVDYAALPRVIQKTAARSLAEWRSGSWPRLRLAQGGSTITQQLVRVYFLGYLTARLNDDAVFRHGLTLARVMSGVLGAPAANKLLRKVEELRLSLWLEEAMRTQYGTREQAKREIFARYASFIYMGSGRYGFGAASEYYFDKPLSGYTAQDAGRAALLAGIGKSPGEYAPVPGNARSLQRRNQILALMARNGYIPGELARRCQAEPLGIVRRAVAKTEAPAAIEHVLDELQAHGGALFTVEDLFQGRIRVRSTIDQRVQKVVNEALENGLVPLREAAFSRTRSHPGLGGGAGQRRRRDPRRGGWTTALQPSLQPLLRLQPRDRLSASARIGDEAIRLPGRVSQRHDARCHRARPAHQRAGWP